MRPTCPLVSGRAFDPMDPDQAGNPYPWLAAAQREQPVFYMPEYDIWCVTRHQDALEVIHDVETFSSRKVVPTPPEGPPSLVAIDPPAHTRLRKLAQKGFSPRLVAEHEAGVRALCDALVDEFVADGRCDFVEQYANRLPSRAITLIVGAPIDRSADFARWAHDRIVQLNPRSTEEERSSARARMATFAGWLEEFVEERRARPQGDLTSELVHATTDDLSPALSTPEVVSLIATVLSAGSSTTANMLPVMVREVVRRPDVWAKLQAKRELTAPAVEESLRLLTSVRGVTRTANREAMVGGVTIPEGADLYVHLGAAQRDPAVFEEPETFDIHRDNLRQHFAFGRWAHICLGAPLARLELRVTLECLMDRLQTARLVPAQREEWIPHILTPGLRSLLLEWEP